MQYHHETDDAADRQEPPFTSTDGDFEDSELDEIDPDDPRWDAFIADDDERDPQPEHGDFWPAD
ncbi:MAG TPA: hypothetical protein VH107_07290 [Lacipirellulaceae bacterium]|jgi:hypothetical protein|nr:hypothetical protein [Lacipirellulaceae bacterium]